MTRKRRTIHFLVHLSTSFHFYTFSVSIFIPLVKEERIIKKKKRLLLMVNLLTPRGTERGGNNPQKYCTLVFLLKVTWMSFTLMLPVYKLISPLKASNFPLKPISQYLHSFFSWKQFHKAMCTLSFGYEKNNELQEKISVWLIISIKNPLVITLSQNNNWPL